MVSFNISLSKVLKNVMEALETFDPNTNLTFEIETPSLYEQLIGLAELARVKAKPVSAEELVIEASKLLDTYSNTTPIIYVPHIRDYDSYPSDDSALTLLIPQLNPNIKKEEETVTQYLKSRNLKFRVSNLFSEFFQPLETLSLFVRGGSEEVVLSENLKWGLDRMSNENERKFSLLIICLHEQGHEIYTHHRFVEYKKKMKDLEVSRTPTTFRSPITEDEDGEAGDVTEYVLINGIIQICMTVSWSSRAPAEVRVIYYPANGQFKKQPCFFSPQFMENFLDSPRTPKGGDFAPIPDGTCILDLCFASGQHHEVLRNQMENEKMSTAQFPKKKTQSCRKRFTVPKAAGRYF